MGPRAQVQGGQQPGPWVAYTLKWEVRAADRWVVGSVWRPLLLVLVPIGNRGQCHQLRGSGWRHKGRGGVGEGGGVLGQAPNLLWEPGCVFSSVGLGARSDRVRPQQSLLSLSPQRTKLLKLVAVASRLWDDPGRELGAEEGQRFFGMSVPPAGRRPPPEGLRAHELKHARVL